MTTEKYNAVNINSKHSVAFKNKFSNDQLYYFDFSVKKWIKCYPINTLPYNLCSFRLENSTDEQCVVTSLDSYRLISNLNDAPNNEEMFEESVWREEIVKKDAELDFIKDDGIYKGKVCWTKSDIIPGVILIGPRSFPNLNSFGYYYKESKKLAKSCTYTDIISEEELNKEKNTQEYYEMKFKEEKETIQNMKKNLDYYCPKEYLHLANQSSGICGKVGFYDLLAYYQRLKIYSEPITFELVNKLHSKNNDFVTDHELAESQKLTNVQNVLMAVVLLSKENFDGAYGEEIKDTEEIKYHNTQTSEKCVYLNGCEAFFDIKIYNATYAKLSFGDKVIELDKVDDVFTLSDINIDNPLFCPICACGFYIITDGDKSSYKFLIFDSGPRHILYGFDNCYQVSWLFSKNTVLLAGNAVQPSIICSINDLVKIKENTQEINKKYLDNI